MFGTIESLMEPVVNVQLLDLYFKDNGIKTHEMFYRDEYVYDLEKNKGLLNYYKKSGKIEEDDDLEIYTFNDVLEILVNDFDTYSYMYKVPPINMENVEWELLFATIANYYKDKEFSYSFADDMRYLNRMVIAKSMIYEDECIDLKTYISSLKYLESNVISLVNIVEIARDLSVVFGIDTFSLLANEDGSYGCIGKCAELVFVDGEDQETLEKATEKISKELKEKGFSITQKLEVNRKKEDEEKSNVVSIKSHKMKQKKRFDNK